MSLNHYYTLGRSGLRVSRLALGTMTFGTEWGWGSDKDAARTIFDRYVDAGGNFIDTADVYTQGTSESWLGEFIAARGLRDKVVLATKFSHPADPGNPNACGNGRMHIVRAVEASLKRLNTDHLDLYFLHTWDQVTPVDEVMRSLDDLVRAGKVRHIGLSDVPAWYASRAQALAEFRGLRAGVRAAARILAGRAQHRVRIHAARDRSRHGPRRVEPARERLAERQVPARRRCRDDGRRPLEGEPRPMRARCSTA